ncbi:MAG: hypothetical protein HY237_14900 [Acidobacteria bacterium]|nr:hypothetical protein [Acidobacteriota bacterium]
MQGKVERQSSLIATGGSHPVGADKSFLTRAGWSGTRWWPRIGSRVASLAVALALLLLASAARAQISPGPLSRAHQSLSGQTQCASCHKFGAGAPQLRCLDCHAEIARRLEEQHGLHAALVSRTATSQDCARCHSEHNGENFNLIQWDASPKTFDHNKTGYVLEGKHAGLACNKCHAPEHIREPERRTIRMKDLRRTFLGLSRDCLSCHVDRHRGQLLANCLECHTFAEWKGASRFNHAKARYPLTGLHAQVACLKCHPATGAPERVVKYVELAFDKCVACHTDPHRGAFPNACQSCHTTSGWKHVQMAVKFDHSKTHFPLLGKHAAVRCGQCHAAGDFKKPLAYQKCTDCHKPDPHGGQFAKRRDAGDCTACHTLEGFKPARFGVKEHAATLYPLNGRHAEVPCAKCHLPAGRATRYKIGYALCTECHIDPHKSQFAGAPHLNRCEGCHTVEGFRPSTFTLARHQTSRFPLAGGHVAVACIECHKVDAARKPPPPVPYRFEDRACTACHTDPHRGQFLERMRKPRRDGTLPGCEACHSVKSWRDLARFDHSTTSFKLLGAHRTVPCARCHKPEKLGTTMKSVNFRSAAARCEGCHPDVHAGQFSAHGKPPDCASCHNSTKWKPSLFDHEKRTAFPLQGAHKDVRCAECHKTTKMVEGKAALFYKPTPRECKACHGTA